MKKSSSSFYQTSAACWRSMIMSGHRQMLPVCQQCERLSMASCVWLRGAPRKSIRNLAVWKGSDVSCFSLCFDVHVQGRVVGQTHLRVAKLRLLRRPAPVYLWGSSHFYTGWKMPHGPSLPALPWHAVCCWTSMHMSEFSCELQDWILLSHLDPEPAGQTEAHVWSTQHSCQSESFAYVLIEAEDTQQQWNYTQTFCILKNICK